MKHVGDLKKSGLEIKDIQQFFKWVQEGPSSYKKRKELFESQKTIIENKIKQLNKSLAMINFKCWYYDTAIKDGNEDRLSKMIPNNLPKEIKEIYNISHYDN